MCLTIARQWVRVETVVARYLFQGVQSEVGTRVCIPLRNDTPHLGLWLDTSAQTPDQTVDEILARGWAEARIPESVE